jgi:YVTN family beta-propeller protein
MARRFPGAPLRPPPQGNRAAAGAAQPLLYVTDNTNSRVLALNSTTGAVVATIPVGRRPATIAANAAGTRAYVANTFANSISVIDTASNTVVGGSIAVGTAPQDTAIKS